MFGEWFKLRRQEGAFEAFRVAHLSMELAHLPMYGIDQKALALSGEEIPTPIRGMMPANDPIEEARLQLSSQTTCGQPPPCGTGDDPFGLTNLTSNLTDDKPVRLEGIPPDRYKGN